MVLDKMESVLHPVSPTEYSCKTWTEYIGQFSEDYEKSIISKNIGKEDKNLKYHWTTGESADFPPYISCSLSTV